MATAIYTQTIIAIVWDFDRTLIPNYSQSPLFKVYNVDEKRFWDETNALKELYAERKINVGEDTAYLLHMLTYVREGIFAGLTNSRLRELGHELEMCPGIPEFLHEVSELIRNKERFAKHNIEIEHYVVSTGIRPLIEGSAVGEIVRAIWANEFVDQPPPPNYLAEGHEFGAEGEIAQIGYMIDNTSKTRAIFEINKGPDYPVNSRVAEEDRRVPIRNMIYVADGPSDVPVFSVIQQYGGRSLGVYQTGERSNYEGVKQLEDDARVNSIAPADFRDGQPAYLWLTTTVRQIATRICDERDRYFSGVKTPAGHVTS
jgi:hypothetical protein